jgi:hypothetical protein
VEDLVIAVAVLDGSGEKIALLLEIRATHVVALSECLVTAASTHQLMAELIEACAGGGVGGVRAEGDDHGDEDQTQRSAEMR